MAAMANITVYDGASTPVAHTLVPVSCVRDKGTIEAQWRENAAGVPVNAQIYLTLRLQQLKSGIWKSEARLVVPTMESVSGQNAAGYTAAPKVAYEDTEVYIGFHHPRSTTTGRRLARQMLVNLANNVITSVAAATSGFIPDLIDSLLAPT